MRDAGRAAASSEPSRAACGGAAAGVTAVSRWACSARSRATGFLRRNDHTPRTATVHYAASAPAPARRRIAMHRHFARAAHNFSSQRCSALPVTAAACEIAAAPRPTSQPSIRSRLAPPTPTPSRGPLQTTPSVSAMWMGRGDGALALLAAPWPCSRQSRPAAQLRLGSAAADACASVHVLLRHIPRSCTLATS